MKSEAVIKAKIKELQEDERLKYPTATIGTNAPLALIQLEFEAKIKALQWVLQK